MVIPPELKSLYPFTPKKFQLSSGHQISYIDQGSGNPIVMLHGNPTWSFYYRQLINEFSSTHRIIVPDHLGCGLSDRPQEYQYTLANHIDNLKQLLSSLNLNQVTLILHDWGGAIGMGYAVDHCDKLNKIIILNTAAYTSKYIPWQINLCRFPLLGEFMIRYFNLFAWPATFMAVSKKLPPLVKQGLLLPYDSYANRIAIARFVQDIPMNKRHPSYQTLRTIEDKLPNILCDKLIIWGEKDFCFNRRFLKRWQEIYPTAQTHLLKNAGHYLLEDANSEIIPLIRTFL